MIEYLHSAHWSLVIFCNNFKRKEDSILALNIELVFFSFLSECILKYVLKHLLQVIIARRDLFWNILNALKAMRPLQITI